MYLIAATTYEKFQLFMEFNITPAVRTFLNYTECTYTFFQFHYDPRRLQQMCRRTAAMYLHPLSTNARVLCSGLHHSQIRKSIYLQPSAV